MYYIKARFDSALGEIPEKVKRLVEDMLKLNMPRPHISESSLGWIPEADMFETNEEIILRVNLAGVRKEDIELSFHENALRVSGRRNPFHHGARTDRFILLEMGSGEFERIFRLSCSIAEQDIEASLSDGILTVRMKRQIRPALTHVQIKD
jgi:HSP20 family protein